MQAFDTAAAITVERAREAQPAIVVKRDSDRHADAFQRSQDGRTELEPGVVNVRDVDAVVFDQSLDVSLGAAIPHRRCERRHSGDRARRVRDLVEDDIVPALAQQLSFGANDRILTAGLSVSVVEDEDAHSEVSVA